MKPSSLLISAAVEVTVVPLIERASVSSVPSMSALPEMSKPTAFSVSIFKDALLDGVNVVLPGSVVLLW